MTCPQHPHRKGLQFSSTPPPLSGLFHPSPISLSKLLPAPVLLFCLCYLCLLLTAGPSLAAPSSEDYPIIPLAQHVLPSSRAISSLISLSLSSLPGLVHSLPCSFPSQARGGSVPSHRHSESKRAGRDLCVCASTLLFCREGNSPTIPNIT